MQETLSNIEEYLSFQKDVFGDDTLILEDITNSIAKELNDSLKKESIAIAIPNEIDAPAVSSVSNVDDNTITKTIDEPSDCQPIDKPIAVNIEKEAEKSSQVTESKSLVNNDDWRQAESLEVMAHCIKNCTKCKLSEYRNNVVFGTGNPNADIMVIGEGPGADEDMTGYPFVGRAGQLLTKILAAIDFSREEVYIANIVKCRPPKNRRPEADEVEACEPYLHKQIELIAPKFILALGLTAIDTLFKRKFKMGEIRGQLMEYQGIKTLATYHPAALLRNPNFKKDTWEDVKLLKKLYLESKEQEL